MNLSDFKDFQSFIKHLTKETVCGSLKWSQKAPPGYQAAIDDISFSLNNIPNVGGSRVIFTMTKEGDRRMINSVEYPHICNTQHLINDLMDAAMSSDINAVWFASPKKESK